MDTFDGLTYAGTSLLLKVRQVDAQRLCFTSDDVARAINTAMLGDPASVLLEGDRVVTIRVKVDPDRIDRISTLEDLPIRSPNGSVVHLSDLVDVREEAGQLELRREDLRQDIAVTARLENRDLGSAMAEIQQVLGGDASLNVVSFLGTIIGIGIVAKNGILMLDFVEHFVAAGDPFDEALVKSGRRRHGRARHLRAPVARGDTHRPAHHSQKRVSAAPDGTLI